MKISLKYNKISGVLLVYCLYDQIYSIIYFYLIFQHVLFLKPTENSAIQYILCNYNKKYCINTCISIEKMPVCIHNKF